MTSRPWNLETETKETTDNLFSFTIYNGHFHDQCNDPLMISLTVFFYFRSMSKQQQRIFEIDLHEPLGLVSRKFNARTKDRNVPIETKASEFQKADTSLITIRSPRILFFLCLSAIEKITCFHRIGWSEWRLARGLAGTVHRLGNVCRTWSDAGPPVMRPSFPFSSFPSLCATAQSLRWAVLIKHRQKSLCRVAAN